MRELYLCLVLLVVVQECVLKEVPEDECKIVEHYMIEGTEFYKCYN